MMARPARRHLPRFLWATIAAMLLSVGMGLRFGLYCVECRKGSYSHALKKHAAQRTLFEEEEAEPGCPVTPRFAAPVEYDNFTVDDTPPDHVHEFDKKGYRLPYFNRSELYVVSLTSNATYKRTISQKYTFGRIYDIKFIGSENFHECVLCDKQHHDNACHCPSYKEECHKGIFFDKKVGWWCSCRRETWMIMDAMKDWEGELPKWMHAIEDGTFINPISMQLLLQDLDPDTPYFMGQRTGQFLVGGPGKLISRGLLKLLLGPPVNPVVTYHWPNGTHSVRPKSQVESCVMRMQGGDWCYFHGDWGLSECVRELEVPFTNLVGEKTCGFFAQSTTACERNDSHPFALKSPEFSMKMLRTHAVSLHIGFKDMFDIFYNITVPYYNTLFGNLPS